MVWGLSLFVNKYTDVRKMNSVKLSAAWKELWQREHRKTKDALELRKDCVKLWFRWGDRLQLDDWCYDTVAELKEIYPHIKRIKYRSDYSGELIEFEKSFFPGDEDNICPEGMDGTGRISYVKHNQAMVAASDICIFYYDEGYQPSRRKVSRWSPPDYQPNSCTQLVFESAVQKYMTIINLYNTTI